MKTLSLLVLMALVGACAPPVSLRPAHPLLPGKVVELGMGYALVSPRPVGQEPWRHAGQGWASYQPVSWFELSLIGAFDAVGGTGGLGLRFRIIDLDRVSMGIGLELGVGWAAVEFPLAVRLVDWTWVYLTPQLSNWGTDLTLRTHLGVGVRVWDALMLRLEGQYNVPDLEAVKGRFHMGFGVAYQL